MRIEAAGSDAAHPATTLLRDRLAFSRLIEDEDLYRLDVGGVTRPLVRSSVKETDAQMSPDGKRIVFCSVRSGFAVQLFVADSDGSRPEQLTRGPGRWQCSPAWSPKGKRIAFDSQADDGSWHVWTIDAQGGVPQQITRDAGDQIRPTWSHDGEWIYFIFLLAAIEALPGREPMPGSTGQSAQRDGWSTRDRYTAAAAQMTAA